MENKTKLVLELENKIKNNIEENRLYLPYINTYYKRNHPELYGKYEGLTMKDIINSDFLTEEICDIFFNVYEWFYECNAGCRGDNENFFNIIPPLLSQSKYSKVTSFGITHSKIKKIEYLPNIIKKLDLCCNQIEKIENIPDTVEILYLSSNKIEKIENIPDSVIILNLHGNNITKLENLPRNIDTLTIDYEKITTIGDISNIKKNIKIEHNCDMDITKIPLSKLILTLNYYPKSVKVINYINIINLQYHYFRKWREIILTKKIREKYKYLINDKDDEIDKLKRLLFYLLSKKQINYSGESYGDYFSLKEEPMYFPCLGVLKDFKTYYSFCLNYLEKDYNENKQKAFKYLTNKIMDIVGGKCFEQKYHKIKISLNPYHFKNIKKKKIINKRVSLTIDCIKEFFKMDLEIQELLNYFIDNKLININEITTNYEKNSNKYILKYPFYINENMLYPFLDIDPTRYKYYKNEEIIDSEEESNDTDTEDSDFGLFD